MNKLNRIIEDFRVQALNRAEEMTDDPDDILGLEADFFEEMFGSFLVDNPEFIKDVSADEIEDLLNIDFDEFIDNVVKSQHVEI
jgi:hypothetical protein